jgi:hypothetical protein
MASMRRSAQRTPFRRGLSRTSVAGRLPVDFSAVHPLDFSPETRGVLEPHGTRPCDFLPEHWLASAGRLSVDLKVSPAVDHRRSSLVGQEKEYILVPG